MAEDSLSFLIEVHAMFTYKGIHDFMQGDTVHLFCFFCGRHLGFHRKYYILAHENTFDSAHNIQTQIAQIRR